MGFPTLASFHRDQEEKATTGQRCGITLFPPCRAIRTRTLARSYPRTLCRSRTTKTDPAADQKKKQSPTRAAVATFIPASRCASTQAAKPKATPAHDTAETLLVTAHWMGSKFTLLRIPVPCPIPNSLDRPGHRSKKLQHLVLLPCGWVKGTDTSAHHQPACQPILRFEGGTTVSSTRPAIGLCRSLSTTRQPKFEP